MFPDSSLPYTCLIGRIDDKVMMFTQRVMSEYTIWFFVSLIVTATWAIMSLMIAAMLARFKAVSLDAERRLMQEKAEVRQCT